MGNFQTLIVPLVSVIITSIMLEEEYGLVHCILPTIDNFLSFDFLWF